MLRSGAENVNATVQLYAPFGSTPIAVRTATRTFTNATFDNYGFPIALDGYDETSSDTLSIASSKAIDSGAEFVLGPAQSGKSNFCSDSAGFSATGVQTLNETFGWQGGVLSGGSRTVNADGSVTWAATHTGFSAKGALGSLSVNAGTQNTACPITTPMFMLAGGTTLGNYTIPISVTYLHGMVESLTISNATLTNGDTLNVSTTASAAPSSSSFITASVASGGTQISILAVNGYGDGTLTVTATGRQFAVVDWHVVH